MRIVVSAKARAGLREIALFMGCNNKTRARSFVQELQAIALKLADFPEAYPLIPRYEQHGVRRRPFADYLIFYRIEEDRIEVVHIVHGARDYETLLFAQP